MKIKKSPLEILDFAIINCEYTFLPPDEDDNVALIARSYEIDIDFAIQPDKDQYRIFMKCIINKGETPKSGYSIFAEGVSMYQLTEKLNDTEASNLIAFSGISMTLNSLRGFVSALTAHAPLGKYIIPSIDIKNLIDAKSQLRNKKRSSKKTNIVKKKKS